jgi:hypothetical protein
MLDSTERSRYLNDYRYYRLSLVSPANRTGKAHLMAQEFLAPDAPKSGARAIVTATAWLAVLVIMLMIYAAAMSLGQKLIGGEYVFTLPGNFTDNEVTLPDIGTATVVSAYQSMDVNLTLTHVGGGIIALVILEHVFALALVGGIGSAIIFLCNQVLKGKPFVHSVTVVLTAMAIVLVVVGLGTDLTTNWLQALVQQEVTGGSPDTVLGVNWHFSFPSAWLLPALATSAIAVAFRYGEKLQADTVRLLRYNTRLQRDTDGLV